MKNGRHRAVDDARRATHFRRPSIGRSAYKLLPSPRQPLDATAAQQLALRAIVKIFAAERAHDGHDTLFLARRRPRPDIASEHGRDEVAEPHDFDTASTPAAQRLDCTGMSRPASLTAAFRP